LRNRLLRFETSKTLESIVPRNSNLSSVSPNAGGAAGTLATAKLHIGGLHTQDAFDRITYVKASGDLYYDPDGSGVKAAVKIAHLTAGLDFTINDFEVI